MILFDDRRQAGRDLATRLRNFRSRDTCVLALPRGGVPVAYEVARALRAPLDVLIVRKLGVPGHEELAMGAIASGGARVLNQDVIAALTIPSHVIEEVTRRERTEIERRMRAYRGRRKPLQVENKTVIIVDDGLATGATMKVAVAAVRALEPERVVVAVPVAPSEAVAELRSIADEVICITTPSMFLGVGNWYLDFDQTTDEEVGALLHAVDAWGHETGTGSEASP